MRHRHTNAMSEVAQESHEDIHRDYNYGTLSATEYFLLACKVVWILGMQCLSLLKPHKSLLLRSNLLTSLRDTKIPTRPPIVPFPSLPTLISKLSQNLPYQNVSPPKLILSILPNSPSRSSLTHPITEQTGSSPTVRSASSSVPRPPPSFLPAATAPIARISTTASLVPSSLAIGFSNLPSLIPNHRGTQTSHSFSSTEAAISPHDQIPISCSYSAWQKRS